MKKSSCTVCGVGCKLSAPFPPATENCPERLEMNLCLLIRKGRLIFLLCLSLVMGNYITVICISDLHYLSEIWNLYNKPGNPVCWIKIKFVNIIQTRDALLIFSVVCSNTHTHTHERERFLPYFCTNNRSAVIHRVAAPYITQEVYALCTGKHIHSRST